MNIKHYDGYSEEELLNKLKQRDTEIVELRKAIREYERVICDMQADFYAKGYTH